MIHLKGKKTMAAASLPSKKATCKDCEEVDDYYAMFNCDRCRKYSCTDCAIGRKLKPGSDKRFFDWFCTPCKYAIKTEKEEKKRKKEEKKKQASKSKKKKGESSKSKSSKKPRGDTSSDSDEGAAAAAAHCYMLGVESDSGDSESELEWDSEGNLPIQKAFCAECKKEGDYWVMFECHRCRRVYHPPCITPDGKEAVVMDHRYDSYVCPDCETLYALELFKRQMRASREESSSTQYEEEFGNIISCRTCNQKGNSWDMFECSECGGTHHPSCATQTVEANDNRFDCYECPKCIIKQVQAEVRAIKDLKSKAVRLGHERS